MLCDTRYDGMRFSRAFMTLPVKLLVPNWTCFMILRVTFRTCTLLVPSEQHLVWIALSLDHKTPHEPSCHGVTTVDISAVLDPL
jgi:hypothetical protein